MQKKKKYLTTPLMYHFWLAKVPFVATKNENKYRKTINQITRLISVKITFFSNLCNILYYKQYMKMKNDKFSQYTVVIFSFN